jgi:hypothetical protein
MKRFYAVILVVMALATTVTAQPTSASASESSQKVKEFDPLLEVPPLPKGKVTLVGGRVKSIDHIRNRMEVESFGGGKLKVRFDERTRIFRDGIETTQLGVQRGDRVYVDTMLVDAKVFARNIRVQTQTQAADAKGQLLYFDRRRGIITMRDQLSAHPVSFVLGPESSIRRADDEVPAAQLEPGALIAVRFAREGRERPVAREITVFAIPGNTFQFAGRLTHLDLRSGMLALENRTDNKIYDLYFDSDAVGQITDLRVGAEVSVLARFAGRNYVATNIEVITPVREEVEKE